MSDDDFMGEQGPRQRRVETGRNSGCHPATQQGAHIRPSQPQPL